MPVMLNDHLTTDELERIAEHFDKLPELANGNLYLRSIKIELGSTDEPDVTVCTLESEGEGDFLFLKLV